MLLPCTVFVETSLFLVTIWYILLYEPPGILDMIFLHFKFTYLDSRPDPTKSLNVKLNLKRLKNLTFIVPF